MKLSDITQCCHDVWGERKWTVVAGASILISGIAVYKLLRKKKEWPKDMVILHQIRRKDLDFTATPFGVKLEAYFRIANIPYINDETTERSSKKKTPWIELNGEPVADSNFIIEFLNKKFSIDLNMALSVEQLAIGRGFCKMVDEHLYWTMVMSRWYHDIYDLDPPGLGLFSPLFYPIMRVLIYRQGWYQGVGRHNREENNHLMYGDLKALSDYLGKKKYLFGDQPCEVDCVVFGQLSQFCWHMPNLYGEKLIHETFQNLRDYCYRMKKCFWPDLGTDARSKSKKQ